MTAIRTKTPTRTALMLALAPLLVTVAACAPPEGDGLARASASIDVAEIAIPIEASEDHPLFPALTSWPRTLMVYFYDSALPESYQDALVDAGIKHSEVVSFARTVDQLTTSNGWITRSEVVAYVEAQADAPLADVEAALSTYPLPVQRADAMLKLMTQFVFTPAASIPELSATPGVEDVDIVVDQPPTAYFDLPGAGIYGHRMWLYPYEEFVVPIRLLDVWTRERLHYNHRIAPTLPYATKIVLRVPASRHGIVTPIGILNDAYWVDGY